MNPKLLLTALLLSQIAALQAATVRLAWDPALGPWIAGYYVYRSTESGGPFSRLNQDLTGSPFFEDRSAEPGTRYYFAVTVVDGEGRESELSKPLPVDVPSLDERSVSVQILPERRARSGQLVVLTAHRWPEGAADTGGDLEWSQIEGPAAPMVSDDAEAPALLAPEVHQATSLVFRASRGSQSWLVRVVVEP